MASMKHNCVCHRHLHGSAALQLRETDSNIMALGSCLLSWWPLFALSFSALCWGCSVYSSDIARKRRTDCGIVWQGLFGTVPRCRSALTRFFTLPTTHYYSKKKLFALMIKFPSWVDIINRARVNPCVGQIRCSWRIPQPPSVNLTTSWSAPGTYSKKSV